MTLSFTTHCRFSPAHQAIALNDELTNLLRDRALRDPDNQRLLNGAGAQQDRGNLLRFLSQDGVEPTNNRAERDLRPAVIARKVHTLRKTEPLTLAASLAALLSPQSSSG